jgi:hypothetical protein
MTRISGVRILEAPCCAKQYSFPRYMSMNFSAFEYWTDGWREGTLMPNDEGLRHCQCGKFIFLHNMTAINTTESAGLPSLPRMPEKMLLSCIAQATDESMEVAARFEHWRHLNHDYREQYRKHRDAEEAATKAKWEVSHPDTRSRWARFCGRTGPRYIRPVNSALTFPPFVPSNIQVENMARLGKILLKNRVIARSRNPLELVELYREQGKFDEAESTLMAMEIRSGDVTRKLIGELIHQRETAPMRYRM